MINFYETKGVKKYLTKKDNPSFVNTQMDIDSRILVIGASGQGKTNWLNNYIYLSPNTFSHIHIVFKEFEPLYEYLRDSLKGKITFYDDLNKLPDLKEIRKNRDKDDEQLVVIDDWIAEIHKYPKIVDFAIRCRKCNITFIFIAQSYFKIPKPIRSQMTYLILLKVSSGKDLRLIMGDFALGLELDELQDIYKDATKIKMKDFMKIDVNSGEANKKFSKNWKDFYEVEKEEQK